MAFMVGRIGGVHDERRWLGLLKVPENGKIK